MNVGDPMKKTVSVATYCNEIMQALPKGVLLTTADGDKVNTMTIGWGHVGIEWGKEIFVAYVRESRYTKEMLEKTGEFTVNIPLGGCNKEILGFCGTKSGREVDKIRALGLTLEPSDLVGAPGIKELPLTLECKVIYKQTQDLSAIPQEIINRYYPKDAAGKMDGHIAYYGQIVNAYVIG